MRIPASTALLFKQTPQRSEFRLFAQSGEYVWTGRVDEIGGYAGGMKIRVTTLSGDRTRLQKDMSIWFGTDAIPYLKGTIRLISTSAAGAGWFVIPFNTNGIAVGDIVSVDIVPRLYAINMHHDYGDILPVKSFPPYANMGPHRAGWTGEPLNFYADNSWAQRGRTIVSHAWDFGPNTFVSYPANDPNGSGTAATPIAARWTVPGDYWVIHTVTDSAGQTHTSWRVVIIRDRTGANAPYDDFTVSSVTGTYSDGGWSSSITVWTQADKTNFPDNGVVILHAKDYYGEGYESLQNAGLQHMEDYVLVGYTKSTTGGKEADVNQPVTLEVATIHSFAKDLTVWDADIVPTDASNPYHNLYAVTLAEVVYHLLTEHSTFATCNDALIFSLDKRVDFIYLTESSLWDQLDQQVGSARLLHPTCDRYGRLWMHRDANLRTADLRAQYGTAEFDFTNEFWSRIDLGEERPRERVAQIDATGAFVDTRFAPSQFNVCGVYMLWPPIQNSYGSINQIDEILIPAAGKAQAETELLDWAKLSLFKANTRFPLVTVDTWNIRAFDPAEQPYVTVSLAVEDTLEGWSWDHKEFIVRECTYNIDTDRGFMSVQYGLEDSVWGSDGIAGQYPDGSPGPDYTSPGGDTGSLTGKSVLACWRFGVLRCQDITTPPANWEDRTSNLASLLGRAINNYAPRLNGVERDPYNPTNRWWTWGHLGVAYTANAGSSWTLKVTKSKFNTFMQGIGTNLSADELNGFCVIRHKSIPGIREYHLALILTRYPGEIGRSKLWCITTNNDWDTIRSATLLTSTLTNPGEFSGPDRAHIEMHPWPLRQPSGFTIGYVTTSHADVDTVQLWYTINGGLHFAPAFNGTQYGFDGLWPDRVIIPPAGNDDGDVAYWVESGYRTSGTGYVKITGGASGSAALLNFQWISNLVTTGPTFGVGSDPPLGAYPALDYFRSAGQSTNPRTWEKRGAGAVWVGRSAPPGIYQGFAQWPYNFDKAYISTNGPFVNGGGMFFYTTNGGANWVDATGNLAQLMVPTALVPLPGALWSIQPDPTV